MTIYYLDTENGNDANDGLTFANRKQTVSALTSVLLSPGDTVRVIASPDDANLGDATWTDGSGTVTFASAKNKVIDDCASGWVASPNITVTHSAARTKVGSTSLLITPATAFTTGKAAYKTLPATLDLSAFQGISFWQYGSAVSTPGQIIIRLCSDTTGDTVLYTLSGDPAINSSWCAHSADNGAPLTGAINSISVAFTADPGTTGVYLSNIVACKAQGTSDYLTHKHAISKNTATEKEKYSILSISDVGIVLGGHAGVNLGTSSQVLPPVYNGTTETVATYAQLGILPNVPTSAASTIRYISDSGTSVLPITFSGGWDRASMSTQSGVTYFQGRYFMQYAIFFSGRNYLSFEKIGGINFIFSPIFASSACRSIRLDSEHTCGCAYGPIYSGASSDLGGFFFAFKSIQGAESGKLTFGYSTAGLSSRAITLVKGDRILGAVGTSSASGLPALSMAGGVKYYIGRIDGSTNYGVSVDTTAAGEGELHGTVLENNGRGDAYLSREGSMRLLGCTYSSVVFDTNTLHRQRFRSTRKGGVATAHETLSRYFNLYSESSVRHTASGIAWKLTPLDTTECYDETPANFTLAKVAVNGGTLVTVKCWLRRDNAGISAGIRLVPDDIAGDPLTTTGTNMTAAVDTWEEVIMTFTPSAAGVVEIEGVAWGGTTYAAYFDDLTVTQA